jgi:putative endonuclease
MHPVHTAVNQRVTGSSPVSGAKASHVRGAFLFSTFPTLNFQEPPAPSKLVKPFMTYYIYILHSQTSDKYYIGYSSDPFRRLQEHNNTPLTTYTSKHRPWYLKAIYNCGDNESAAIQIERFIKKQKSRILIEKLIAGTELSGILAQLVRVPYLRDASRPYGG